MESQRNIYNLISLPLLRPRPHSGIYGRVFSFLLSGIPWCTENVEYFPDCDEFLYELSCKVGDGRSTKLLLRPAGPETAPKIVPDSPKKNAKSSTTNENGSSAGRLKDTQKKESVKKNIGQARCATATTDPRVRCCRSYVPQTDPTRSSIIMTIHCPPLITDSQIKASLNLLQYAFNGELIAEPDVDGPKKMRSDDWRPHRAIHDVYTKELLAAADFPIAPSSAGQTQPIMKAMKLTLSLDVTDTIGNVEKAGIVARFMGYGRVFWLIGPLFKELRRSMYLKSESITSVVTGLDRCILLGSRPESALFCSCHFNPTFKKETDFDLLKQIFAVSYREYVRQEVRQDVTSYVSVPFAAGYKTTFHC